MERRYFGTDRCLNGLFDMRPKEYEELIYEYNKTDKEYPQSTVHSLFSKQVKETPNNIALVYEDKELSYKELDELSNQLARVIQREYKEYTDKRLEVDFLIALYLD